MDRLFDDWSTSMGSVVFSNRELGSAKEQRRAIARAALDEMEGHNGSVAWIDDRLDFLAEEISEHMMQELVRTWPTFNMGYPTLSKLAELAETIYLQAAVDALDG
jgi:hypothetical protein